MPDTQAQQALVRTYIALVAAERFPDAWQLLAPERQRNQPPDAFAADWRAWGQLEPECNSGPFVWPAALDEIRAYVCLHRSPTAGAREQVDFDLVRVADSWRIADEHGRGHHDRPAPPTTQSSPVDLARSLVVADYGPIWLSTFDVLYRGHYEEGEVVVFRVVNPVLGGGTTPPMPTAILLFARPQDGGWGIAGGGTIGTIAEMDLWAVSCAWTWLRFVANAPTTAAFYCTIEDQRIHAVELETVDGAHFRSEVAGQRAVIFPFAWNMQAKWPVQQPLALLLYDRDGHPLALPTSPLARTEPP